MLIPVEDPAAAPGLKNGSVLISALLAELQQGAAGSQIYEGVGEPSEQLGNEGDYFIDTSTGNLFGRKAGGVWPTTPIALTSAADQTLTSELSAETTRAQEAEGADAAAIAAEATARQGAVTAEATRAQGAESTNASAIGAETAARQAGDTANATAISAETTARESAISAEATTRAGADTANAAAISAETTRAEAAEATNATAISAETTNREAAITSEATTRAGADTANAAAISAETTRAEAAEATNATAISAETTNREAAITSEATTRASADTANTNAISAEVTRAEGAEGANAAAAAAAQTTANAAATQTALTAETSARQTGDSTNANAISAETTNRQSAVSSEATTRASADTANANAIGAEVTRAEGAESSNAAAAAAAQATANAAAPQTALTAETTARQSGDTTNATAISAEITNRQAAITSEATTRAAADTADAAAAAAAQLTANTALATANAAEPAIAAAPGRVLTGPAVAGGPLGTLAVGGAGGVVLADSFGNISGQTVLPAGGSVALALSGAFILTPRWFGAKGDGVTDDTIALNAWITYIKSTRPNTSAAHLSFVFDPGATHLVSGPLNFGFAFTSGNNPSFNIVGNGATVIGTTAGPAIIDCINFGYGSSIQDLTIIGNSGGAQGYGLVFGYSQGGGSYGFTDTFKKRNVTISGYFAYACQLNRGSDTSSAIQDNNSNFTSTNIGIDIGDSGFCTIIDAQGLWPLTSNIATISALTSANPIEYRRIECVDQSYHGSPFWIDTNVHPDFSGGYANSQSSTPVPGCVIYVLQSLQGGLAQLKWTTHMETTTALSYDFYFYAPWATSSNHAQVVYSQFEWTDLGYEANVSALGSGTYVTYIRLQGMKINAIKQGTGTLLDTPANYLLSGEINGLGPSQWSPPALFNGIFYGSGANTAYTWGAGTALYFNVDSGTGDFAIVGTSTFSLPTLTGPVSTSGNINISDGGGVISAAGSTFATATQLTHQYSVVVSTPGGVILPTGLGCIYYVWNDGGGTLTVYSPAGAVVGTLATNQTGRWYAYNSTTYNPS